MRPGKELYLALLHSTANKSANGITLKFLKDSFAFWCLTQTKIKKIMNFFTRTLSSAKFATVNNYKREM